MSDAAKTRLVLTARLRSSESCITTRVEKSLFVFFVFTSFLIVFRQNFFDVGDDRCNIGVLQFALLVGLVHLHILFGVKNDGDIGVLGNVISVGAGRIVNGQNGVLDLFFFGEILELLFQLGIVIEEHHKAAHFAVFVLGGGLVNFLDQTGQGVADFACEDHRDRTGAVRSDQA